MKLKEILEKRIPYRKFSCKTLSPIGYLTFNNKGDPLIISPNNSTINDVPEFLNDFMNDDWYIQHIVGQEELNFE